MNVKRWTICILLGHKWLKVPYGGHEDTGFFVRCRVCNHENHNVGTRSTGIM
jgi:hypothetical protein